MQEKRGDYIKPGCRYNKSEKKHIDKICLCAFLIMFFRKAVRGSENASLGRMEFLISLFSERDFRGNIFPFERMD